MDWLALIGIMFRLALTSPKHSLGLSAILSPSALTWGKECFPQLIGTLLRSGRCYFTNELTEVVVVLSTTLLWSWIESLLICQRVIQGRIRFGYDLPYDVNWVSSQIVTTSLSRNFFSDDLFTCFILHFWGTMVQAELSVRNILRNTFHLSI